MFRSRRKSLNESRRIRSTEPQPRNVVFSYHANRSIREGSNANAAERLSPDEQAPLKRRRPTVWLRRLPMLLAGGAIAVCCVVLLSLTSNVKIISVTSSDPSTQLFLHDTRTYQQAAQKRFAESWLNANKLTADASGIAASLRAEFPELQNVSIALPIVGRRPLVYVQPANPTLFLTAQGGGVFILDKSGRALVGGSEAASHLARLQLPMVQDESGLRVEVGQVALPSSNVGFVIEVVGQLRAQSLQIDSLRLPSASSELDVKLKGTPYLIKFNMQGPAREQAGQFLASKLYLEGQHQTPSQYIDVRVPQRVYYR